MPESNLYPIFPPAPTEEEIINYNAYIAAVRANFPTHTVIYASPDLDGYVTVERWDGWPSRPARWAVQAWRRKMHSGLRLLRFLSNTEIEIGRRN